MKAYITEPSKDIEIINECDICVIGGSCTGLFAAVRAARLGAKVTLIEKQNCLGGVATSGLVCVWHNLYDMEHKNQVIAGLTYETLERLIKKGVCSYDKNNMSAYRFNPNEMALELDKFVNESKIKIYLHAYYAGVICDGSEIQAVTIATKEGRKAVKAKFYIDATGDGDIAADLKIPSYTNEIIQTPTSCFLMEGDSVDLNKLIKEHGDEVGIPTFDWGWNSFITGSNSLHMRANSHVFDVVCNKADDLTYAEMEGRRQIDGLMTLAKKYGNGNHSVASLCSYIGIRETVHFETKFKANRENLMTGVKYDTAVMNGTYPVDIHGTDGGFKTQNITSDYYQEPFELLVNEIYDNFIAVGRMINADSGAFGALRVMVNLNQLGEAAGVASYIAVDKGIKVGDINGKDVRNLLKSGGSAL
jgi:Dehydrogenases (flavoproteins)